MIICKIIILATVMICISGCSGNTACEKESDSIILSPPQERMIEEGWYKPKNKPNGELAEQYGVKSKYGQQDNYFDINIGSGCDVAVKIMDTATDKCIRYVFVSENSSENIQMIPQGKYYLKLAYGRDWMEFDNGDGTLSAKFTSDVYYDKSTESFDFGKKNSSSLVNYVLNINIDNGEPSHNFLTVSISEKKFFE